MTDLMTRVRAIVDSGRQTKDDVVFDMAQALVLAEKLANTAAPYAHRTSQEEFGLHTALSKFQAAMSDTQPWKKNK